jgi:RNA polymerase sigma factor for flagellar operon FliA
MTSERDALVQRGLPLVEIIARRVHRRLGGRSDLDELRSVCRSALVEIVAAYDPARSPLEAYVARRLMWACYDAVRASRPGLAAARAAALSASQRYGEELRRAEPEGDRLEDAPTEEQAQAKLAKLLEGHAAAMAIALVRAQNDVERAVDPGEGPEERVARAEIEGGLREEVSQLPDRERALVERHYYRDERFEAIADDLGISKAWASRLHAAAISELARRMRVRFGASAAVGT